MTTPIDNYLRDVLGMLRDVHDEANTENVLNWATNLLATLQAPYNISLLTTELLSSPAVWNRPTAPPLATCMRLLAMFRSAAAHFHAKYLEYLSRPPYTCPEHISSDLWANAVSRGLHHQPERWKHLFVLTGVLAGLQDAGARDSLIDTTGQVEVAVANATRLALAEVGAMTDADHASLAEAAITLAVAHACPRLLDTPAQLELGLDDLVPVILKSVFSHPEGLQDCAFMGDMGADAGFDAAGRFDWPQTSRSFRDLKLVAANPLVVALGPVARVLALAVLHTGSIAAITRVRNDLVALAVRIANIWGSNRLSIMEHDPARVSPATQEHALPILFTLQRNILFACAVVMRAIVVRAIGDNRLNTRDIAAMPMHVFHALSFISSRAGNDKFDAYKSTYLAAGDLLATCPGASA
ncbi:peroxin 8, partial [Magnaporthiopsis poae ATCC 64411]